MQEWSLTSQDPLSLTLCADTHLGPVSYTDDQIWELCLQGGEPPALAFETNFGLRACSFRLFPRFVEGDAFSHDPANFTRPVVIRQVLPGYLRLDFSPFQDIDVQMEYWVPCSQGCTGRITIKNSGLAARAIRFDWIGQLSPNEGIRLAPVELQAVTILSGRTGDLIPVIFLSGGPRPAPGTYPALAVQCDLISEEQKQFSWAQASLSTEEESFELARSIANKKWDAEIARLEIIHSGRLTIQSGNFDWDTAMMLSQRMAASLFSGPTKFLPNASFVQSKHPDHGYSILGTGLDYNYLWNGQSALDTFYLCDLLLPSYPALLIGVVQNYFAVQEENGFIDLKPGLAGQRSRQLATPILASLVKRIFDYTQDTDFLEAAINPLDKFLDYWLANASDQDKDGYPEWENPNQLGLDDHPIYSISQPSSIGLDIRTVETPSLGSFLFNECQSMVQIGSILDKTGIISKYSLHAESLQKAINGFWNPYLFRYQTRDRDSHLTPELFTIGHLIGNGQMELKLKLKPKTRLFVTILSKMGVAHRPSISLIGKNHKNRKIDEQIQPTGFRWSLTRGFYTSQNIFSEIKIVKIQGIEPTDEVFLQTAGLDFVDPTQFLPIWAGSAEPDNVQQILSTQMLSSIRSINEFQLQGNVIQLEKSSEQVLHRIYFPLSSLVIEGMLKYGCRKDAARLFGEMMEPVIHSLRKERSFFHYYDAETKSGFGERDHLSGLVPVGLFMDILGVRFYSNRSLEIEGFSPFPWPVSVRLRGTIVQRWPEKTRIQFSDGQEISFEDPEPKRIELVDDQIYIKPLFSHTNSI